MSTNSTLWPSFSSGVISSMALLARAAASSSVSPGPAWTGTCSPEARSRPSRPPAWASASAARHATHPIQNRWPHSPAGAYAPRSAVIPFSDAVQHTVVRKTSQFSGLARPLQRTGKHTALAESFGGRPRAGAFRHPLPAARRPRSTGCSCARYAARIRSTRSGRGAATPKIRCRHESSRRQRCRSRSVRSCLHSSLRSFMTPPLTPIFCAEMIEMLLD